MSLLYSYVSQELPRYSDKYRSSTMDQPALKRKELHAPFFPPELFEGYFNPRRKPKSIFLLLDISLVKLNMLSLVQKASSTAKPRMNLDEMGDEDEDQV
jgi:DNA-directed RNA polymerase III subunit RPC7